MRVDGIAAGMAELGGEFDPEALAHYLIWARRQGLARVKVAPDGAMQWTQTWPPGWDAWDLDDKDLDGGVVAKYAKRKGGVALLVRDFADRSAHWCILDLDDGKSFAYGGGQDVLGAMVIAEQVFGMMMPDFTRGEQKLLRQTLDAIRGDKIEYTVE